MEKKDNSLSLPQYIQVGGQKVDIALVDSIEYNVLGRCHLSEGIIKIADVEMGVNNQMIVNLILSFMSVSMLFLKIWVEQT